MQAVEEDKFVMQMKDVGRSVHRFKLTLLCVVGVILGVVLFLARNVLPR